MRYTVQEIKQGTGFARDAEFVDAAIHDAVVAALRALRRNVDVSTINNSKRSTARWEALIDQADAALPFAERYG